MALLGTCITHLFGGSAGREGTAVQMGASLADALAHLLPAAAALRRYFLIAGVAGGFGSVFGTPVAGAVFAIELVRPARLDAAVLIPAVVAAAAGDFVARALGCIHPQFVQVGPLRLGPLLLGKWLVLAAALAVTAALFMEVTHALAKVAQATVPRLRWRLALGGLVLIALAEALGTRDYLGLGLPGLLDAFCRVDYPPYAFALKLVFTAVTLAAGFVGGEVTPLFFIGAALGNAVAPWLNVPLPLAAGIGMAGMFAGAAHMPVALSVMAVELLGSHAWPHALVVCAVASCLSGQRSIYPAQRRAPAD